MAGDLTVGNLNGVPPVQLSTDEIVQADGSHIKNQVNAWVTFNGSTTPPTIIDSFNIDDVVRTSTGQYTVTLGFTATSTTYSIISSQGSHGYGNTYNSPISTTAFLLYTSNGTGYANAFYVSLLVMGAR